MSVRLDEVVSDSNTGSTWTSAPLGMALIQSITNMGGCLFYNG